MILSAAQMRSAEQALIAAGTSVDDLMQRAGHGAADYVWRLSGGRSVTVLCGPGNNGGDGWVIAEAIRRRGGDVAVVMAAAPATEAARRAQSAYGGPVLDSTAPRRGAVFVDCLFGTGLTRPLAKDHQDLLLRLAAAHDLRMAVDLPSGVDSDRGLALCRDLPVFDLTVALGAWKYAHLLMPAAAVMGQLRLVSLGIGEIADAARLIEQPRFFPPGADAHKYTRGMVGVIGGAMPGAALLAAGGAQGAGAGYVKLLAAAPAGLPADLVADLAPLAEALDDARIGAVLAGPGLGRDGPAREKLAIVLAKAVPTVLDADALVLLTPHHLPNRAAPVIATPHAGELIALERAFGLDGTGSKVERARALAQASGMVVVAKGADTVVAAPNGRIACAARASSWLSTAGTGDVLAGVVASRLAAGTKAFDAACEGVWLHAEAARLCPAPFTATQLAASVTSAYAACL